MLPGGCLCLLLAMPCVDLYSMIMAFHGSARLFLSIKLLEIRPNWQTKTDLYWIRCNKTVSCLTHMTINFAPTINFKITKLVGILNV